MATLVDLKPFPVVSGKYLFWFTPENIGFSVTCQNVVGVNAQGDTFEEALENSLTMAAFVEDCVSEIAKEKPTPKKNSKAQPQRSKPVKSRKTRK